MTQEKMGGKEPLLHIAILPWFALGHMIPFLHLAIALANAGVRITFFSTPRNTRRLPKISPHLTGWIRIVDLPLAHVDDLPEHAEATADVAGEDVPRLKAAYDLLRQPIKQFLADASPDCVVHDFVPYWIVSTARDLGVPCVLLSVYSAASRAFSGPPEAFTEEGRKRWRPSPESMTSPPKWVTFPSTVAFRRWEAMKSYSGAYGVNLSGVSDVERARLAIEGCTAVAVRSCVEYEGEYLELLAKLFRKPVIPVGLLPPAPGTEVKADAGGRGDGGWMFQWLNTQQPKSVVFVSFGSEYKMSKDEIHELAHGLEMSKIPFLWTLRRPTWVSGSDEEALPEGFLARTKHQGAVQFGWAPQLEILAHPAIGGSLFHSGWGSIIETLYHGHVLVLLPLIYDQGLNARLLVEKGLGLEVERDDDGSFHRDKIARSLRMAMVSPEGEGLRRKAREMGATFADQALHDKYVREFIDYLLKKKPLKPMNR